MKFDQYGRELPDPRPLEIPAGYKKPESLTEKIQRMVRTDLSRYAESQGAESFEEANDFEIEEDDALEHPTHHELHEEVVGEVLRAKQEKADADSRRAVRAKESARRNKTSADEVQEEADPSTDRDDLPSRRSRARRSSDYRRSEDAEVDHRKKRTGRVEFDDEE